MLYLQKLLSISIQLLCRFEVKEYVSEYGPILFQYNSCVGSSCNLISSFVSFSSFQYNSCVGSSGDISLEEQALVSFQYNSCVGSRERISRNTKAIAISIQLLCRFELSLYRISLCLPDFNTTLVSVRDLAGAI